MSDCKQLLTIFQRVLQRLDKGVEDYNVLSKIIAERADAEIKFADKLKSLIPADYDQKEPLAQFLITDLQKDVEMHATFGRELAQKLLPAVQTYQTTMKERQKAQQSELKRHCDSIKKVMDDVESAQKNLEQATAKLQASDSSGNRRKRDDCIAKLQKAKVQEQELSAQICARHAPQVHNVFSQFDGSRLGKIQEILTNYAQAKTRSVDGIKDGSETLVKKLEHFDSKDRSERFVTRVFDPQAPQNVDDDEDHYVWALADYRSDDPHDLTFLKGDRIRVIGEHLSGWWEGELDNGQRGTFPRSFIVTPAEFEGKNKQVGAIFLVKRDCQKGDNRLLAGDLVYVDSISKDRFSGTNLRDTRIRGWFPMDILERKIR